MGLTVIDEVGQRLFTDDEVDLLCAKSDVALDLVFAISQKLNGLSGADVEELTKNSQGILIKSQSNIDPIPAIYGRRRVSRR